MLLNKWYLFGLFVIVLCKSLRLNKMKPVAAENLFAVSLSFAWSDLDMNLLGHPSSGKIVTLY